MAARSAARFKNHARNMETSMKMTKATHAALFGLTGPFGISSDADAMQTQTRRVIYRAAPLRAAPVRPPVRMSLAVRTVHPAQQISRPAFNFHQSHTVFSGHTSAPRMSYPALGSHPVLSRHTPSSQISRPAFNFHPPHTVPGGHSLTAGKTPSLLAHGTPPYPAVTHLSRTQRGPATGMTPSLQGHGTLPHPAVTHLSQVQRGPGTRTPQPSKSALQAKGPVASHPNANPSSRLHQREEDAPSTVPSALNPAPYALQPSHDSYEPTAADAFTSAPYSNEASDTTAAGAPASGDAHGSTESNPYSMDDLFDSKLQVNLIGDASSVISPKVFDIFGSPRKGFTISTPTPGGGPFVGADVVLGSDGTPTVYPNVGVATPSGLAAGSYGGTLTSSEINGSASVRVGEVELSYGVSASPPRIYQGIEQDIERWMTQESCSMGCR